MMIKDLKSLDVLRYEKFCSKAQFEQQIISYSTRFSSATRGSAWHLQTINKFWLIASPSFVKWCAKLLGDYTYWNVHADNVTILKGPTVKTKWKELNTISVLSVTIVTSTVSKIVKRLWERFIKVQIDKKVFLFRLKPVWREGASYSIYYLWAKGSDSQSHILCQNVSQVLSQNKRLLLRHNTEFFNNPPNSNK